MSILNDELTELFLESKFVIFKWRNELNWPVEYVTDNVKSLTGYTKKEFESGEIVYSTIIDNNCVNRVEQEVKSAVTNKLSSFTHEPYQIKSKDGTPLWLSDFTKIIRNKSGEVEFFLGYIADITAIKQMETILMIQKSKMESLGELSGMIIHQWKQPLNVISMSAQLIEEEIDTTAANSNTLIKMQKMIMSQVESMVQTADGFQNFYKQSSNFENFCACEQFKTITQLIETKFKRNNIKFKVESHNCFLISGVTSEFQHAIFNIIDNACDQLYLKQIWDGVINISIESDDNFCFIKIKDSAGGIPKHLLPRGIFEKFTSTKTNSTGIGMHISALIIEERMGGKLSVKNVEKGAEFTVQLPLIN